MSSRPVLLSSSLTTFYAVVFPRIWLGGSAIAGSLVLLSESSTVHWTMFLLAPAIWFAVFFYFKFTLFELQQVWMDDAGFCLGELSGRRIPFSSVEEVKRPSFSRPETITIVLKNAEKITFIPRIRLIPFTDHPTRRKILEKMEASLQNENNSSQSSHEP